MGGAGEIWTSYLEVMVRLQDITRKHLVTMCVEKKKPSRAFESLVLYWFKRMLVTQGKCGADIQVWTFFFFLLSFFFFLFLIFAWYRCSLGRALLASMGGVHTTFWPEGSEFDEPKTPNTRDVDVANWIVKCIAIILYFVYAHLACSAEKSGRGPLTPLAAPLPSS